ncbi:hypothetical protein K2X89_15170 [Myxococcota bacterium]|nr:hypothetical protein [Myxococcota bacterium]
MWETPDERLALLELLACGSLKRRRAQEAAFDALTELPWTRASGRRDELRLVQERRHELVTLLERVWPAWRGELADLAAQGLPPTPDGWGRLLDARRATRLSALPDLPERLNRRTAAALAAPHSKAALTDARRAALGETEATHDGTLRLRPPAGLVARTRRGVVDLGAVAHVIGEIAIPERAFLDGLKLEGELRAVVLVENLGAWRDLPAPAGFLLAHVPGWDTATGAQLLDCVAHVPAIHFGDLDPNGVRIYFHLRARRPDLRWFVPEFWGEFVERHGLRVDWPADLDLSAAPALVHELAARGLWLEQERVVVDRRIGEALEDAAGEDQEEE